MTREEAIKQYIMPALKRTWNDDKCIEIISAIEQDPYEVVLNKIQAEVEDINPWALAFAPSEYRDTRPKILARVKSHILEIIEKYKEDT